MEAFLISTLVVAIAEIGDKTQLLSFVLAAKFKRPWSILAGIFVSTLINHAMAGAVGHFVSTQLPGRTLDYIVGFTFLAVAAWALKPDTLDDTSKPERTRNAFLITFIAFFIAEMGDKTQIATVALAAKYSALIAVIAGTTLGMMLANAPAVIIGHKLAAKLPLGLIRKVAAAIFAVLGILTLLDIHP